MSEEKVIEPFPLNATFVFNEDENHVKSVIQNMILKVESDIKNILPACICKIKICYLKIPEKNRVIINKKFSELEDYGRRLWIQNYVTIEEPKRRYSYETGSKCKFSRFFFLPDINNQSSCISVCHIRFLHTTNLMKYCILSKICAMKLKSYQKVKGENIPLSINIH